MINDTNAALRDLMAEHGLTHRETAELLHLPWNERARNSSTLGAWLYGTRRMPVHRLEHLKAALKARRAT